MDKETIRRNILDYKEVPGSRRFVPRDLQIDYAFLRETGKVAAILGPRRAGKPTFLLQIADSHDLEEGARIHIDFSEIVWSEFAGADPAEWTRLYEAALSLHRHPVFLLDEIQKVADFSKGVRTLTNRGCPVFLTGSSAGLFHRELSTVLRGKVLTYTMFPLSFAEFLRFRGKRFGASLSTREAADRRDLLLEYLAWGGFPEVVIAETPELKRSLLESYLDVMLFRDVVERHSVQ
ncbi:MAG: ATP-binding protein, partial [Spirochaetaceae bacterium]